MKKNNFISFLLSLILASSLLPVSRVQAQTGLLPFGGKVAFNQTCDCSGGQFWIFFIPLLLGGPVVTIGPEVYSPYSTVLYGYYNIGRIGLLHSGDYTPGVQSCWIIAGNSCILLQAYGLMSKVNTNY